MRKLIKNKFRKNKAFSFIEVVISIFVISIGLYGAVALISVSLRNSLDSRKQVIASLLAQEGIELIRNIRDSNWVDGNSATTSFSNITGNRIDRTMSAVDATASYALYYSDTTGYIHSSTGTTATPFSRKIIISGSGNERTITSAVIWGASFPMVAISETNCNSGNKCAFAEISLNNWGE